ncbi:hypothetical protein HYS48_00785 [Candidatus Woesearchaeota archaeon]|nr:hypothetical protein [Candidatus Woesearchaeota archaeon]
MEALLYSSILGTFLVEAKKGRLIEKILFSQQNVLDRATALRQGAWIQEEVAVLKKYPNAKITYLGFKEKENIPVTHALETLELVSNAIQEAIAFPPWQERSIMITRKAIRDAFKPELLIIQAVENIAELDKVANILGKRLREWFGYYLPEFSLGNQEKFVSLILEKSKEVLLKELKVRREESMGAEFQKEDVEEMLALAKTMQELFALRKKHEEYLERNMQKTMPNVQAIAGTVIGAKLLALTGTLKRLATFPASTLQVLGAEKALFRHLKTGSRPPKYGILHEHPLIAKAKREKRGKVARGLADKISIAAKVDYFKGAFIGEKLRKELEKKFQ